MRAAQAHCMRMPIRRASFTGGCHRGEAGLYTSRVYADRGASAHRGCRCCWMFPGPPGHNQSSYGMSWYKEAIRVYVRVSVPPLATRKAKAHHMHISVRFALEMAMSVWCVGPSGLSGLSGVSGPSGTSGPPGPPGQSNKVPNLSCNGQGIRRRDVTDISAVCTVGHACQTQHYSVILVAGPAQYA